ncbi:hypothetical protein HYX11_01575 [Candidatus Woesearchaeota archaeon]|nr:hypothetical protein [Candidatus Woesearchaeota archaeon]
MGRTATLSPIDVQINQEENSFGLLSVEKYTEFLNDCLNIYKIKDEQNKTTFLTELTKKLVDQIPPMSLGELFRLRSMTELHAKNILHNYIFKNDSEKVSKSNIIISKFTQESPSHEFEIDLHLVKDSGLKAERMDEKVYILLKEIIDICTLLKREGVICNFFEGSKELRMPYFDIFELTK